MGNNLYDCIFHRLSHNFFSSLIYSRCKNCSKYWCVIPKSSVILNKYQYKEGHFLVDVMEKLEEKYCTNCGYIYRSKENQIVKKLISKKERDKEELILKKKS